MSRIELDAIQGKLKTAIQNHQILVKTKGDQQNVAFKSCLKELQEEIKRLSEEQKKIVVKLRESLVKSSSQSQSSAQQQPQSQTTAIGGVVGGEMSTVLDPQTVSAAIGQSRLMYPTPQGGTILPVGMVAVPLAHVQRPTLGVTFNAGRSQICTPAGNITLQPANYANAVVAAAAGLHGSNSINIPINNGMNNSNTSIALQNSMAINNITNAINVSTLNGNLVNGGINITRLSNPNAPTVNSLNTIIGSAHPIGSIVIGSKALTQLNTNNNVALTTVVNSQGAANMTSTPNGSTAISQSNVLIGAGLPISSANQIITMANGSNPQPASTPTICSSVTSSVPAVSHLSTLPTVAKDKITVLPSQIPQQLPPHQKIHLPQAAQQNLVVTSGNFPIKVPHYTVSPTRTTYCSIAPAPGPVLPTSVVHQPVASTIALTSANVKKPEAAVKPSPSKLSTLPIPSSVVNKGKTAAPTAEPPLQQNTPTSTAKSLADETNKKHEFMKALDLYAPDMLQDLLYKRNERKRRTTANPHYSIGFQSRRWQRNEIQPGGNAFKKAKASKERKPTTKPGQVKEDKMCDNHDDFCAACGKGGQLLMCETCRLVYHLDCLKPPLTEAPKYTWSCPKCLVSGKGSANLNSEALSRVHAYIGKRIAKEDERKKLQRKGAEIRNEKAFLDSRSKKLETDMKDKQDSKRKLADKEKATKKELDQLSVLVQSVRENHSCPSKPSAASSPLAPDNTLSPSNILPSSPCTVPASSVSINESKRNDGLSCIDKENTLSQEDIGDDDRIVLEFKVSAKEFCEIENNSSRNGVVMMETNASAETEMEVDKDDVIESSATQVSTPLPPPPSSPTILTSCGESLKQAVVKPEQQHQQLPISS